MFDLDAIGDIDSFDFDTVGTSDDVDIDSDDDQYQDDNPSDNIDLSETIFPDDFDIDSDDTSTLDLSESNAEDVDDSHHPMTRNRNFRSSNIAFTGNGRCRVCKCGGWAGFGDTCENCGHFYNNHI